MLPYDKKLHLIVGFAICLIGCVILNPIEGIGLAIIAGIFKECYDHYTYGVFDWQDMVVTWAGGCAGFTLFHLLKYWFG